MDSTSQKPIKRAYDQNSKAVDQWLAKDYPKISEKEGAEIHYLDESGLNSYNNYIRSYSPKGKTPIVRMKAKRLSINIISLISKLGKMKFMTYEDLLNTKTFVAFVRRLYEGVLRIIFIILDIEDIIFMFNRLAFILNIGFFPFDKITPINPYTK